MTSSAPSFQPHRASMFHRPLTLQQLQAGAASGAHVTDLIFCVPLCTTGGRVAPTWTPTYALSIERTDLKPLPSVRSPKASLTDDSNAALFGHLHHVVHQTLCPFGEVVPLKHSDWAVPHDLLGPGHGLGVGLGALWSAVQTLKEQIRTVRACRDGSSVPV